MSSPTTDRRLGLVGNTAFKAPVTVLAASNITQSGEQTIDGIGVLSINAAGVPDRVLCTGMTDATKNGIWDVSTSAWTRSKDANSNYDLVKGSNVLVVSGTTYGGSFWQVTASNPITIGTTSMTWGRSLANSATTVSFIQSGAGAVTRTMQDKERDVVDLFDYMTTAQISDVQAGTLTLDVSAAIAAAVLANPNKVILAPPGSYKVTAGTALAAGQWVRGAGQDNTIFSCSDAFDAFTLSSSYSGVSDCSFTSSAARTANAYVKLSAATRGNFVRRVKMTNAYYGIWLAAAAVITYIDSIEMASIAPTTGTGIYINGGNDTLISNVVMDNPAGSQPLAGIRINKTDAVWLNAVDCIHCGTGLLCDPQGATDYITWLFVENSAFDTCASYGVQLAPANAAAVIRGCTFVGSWTSTNTSNGFDIRGAGTVKGLRLIGHRSFNNGQSGYFVNGSSTSTDLNFTGCDASGNSTTTPGTNSGFDIGANVSGFTIQNCRSGQMAGFSNTQSRGILVNPGTSNNYVITDNDLRLNTTSLLDSGSGTNKQVAFNIGDAEMISVVRGLSIVSSNGSAGALALTDTGGSGVNIKLTGDGGTTPSKHIRATGGNLQVVNSAYSAVILALTDAGTLQAKGGIQPGTDAAAFQTACSLYAGTGVPSNANGINGDIYFRSDGGAGTAIYQKRAGAWVGIV